MNNEGKTRFQLQMKLTIMSLQEMFNVLSNLQ